MKMMIHKGTYAQVLAAGAFTSVVAVRASDDTVSVQASEVLHSLLPSTERSSLCTSLIIYWLGDSLVVRPHDAEIPVTIRDLCVKCGNPWCTDEPDACILPARELLSAAK